MRRSIGVLIGFWAIFFVSMSARGAQELCPNGKPLRQLAEAVHRQIGVAVQASFLRDKVYATTVAREFDLLVPEFELKFAQIHPTRAGYGFLNADKITQFAKDHRLKVRGHTLVWHQQVPKWLMDKKIDSKELQKILEEHIRAVVGHYKKSFPGVIEVWDVVNEAIDGKTKELRKSVWSRIGKDQADYIRVAFDAAHAADPSAKLFYNDYGIEGINAKSNNTYKLLLKLKDSGVPIHGIGFQMHWRDDLPSLDIEQLKANIQRFANLGLEVQITEMDYALRLDPKGRVADSQKQEQAQAFHDVAKVCAESPACTAFVTWGVSDRYSWIPRTFRGFGSATILDAGYRHKPAYCALREAWVPAPPSPKAEE